MDHTPPFETENSRGTLRTYESSDPAKGIGATWSIVDQLDHGIWQDRALKECPLTTNSWLGLYRFMGVHNYVSSKNIVTTIECV